MKNMIKTSGLALTMLLFFVYTNAATISDTKEVKIKTSMHCDNCKSKIEKELGKINGIENVSADLNTNIVTVKFEASKVTQEKIMESIRNLGYTAVLDDGKTQQPSTKSDCKTKCASKNKGCCDKK